MGKEFLKRCQLLLLLCSSSLYGAGFVVPSGTTVTTTQTITGNSSVGSVQVNGVISITIAGDDGVDMSAGSNEIMLNQGTISVSSGSYGINNESSSLSAIITNYGVVAGQSPIALINNQGAYAQITNYGVMQMNGGTYGIYNGANYAKIFNAGGIIEAGTAGTAAFYDAGYGTQFTNSGIIKGSLSTTAITMTGPHPNIILMRGSNIQGIVDITSPLNLYVEDGLNLALTLYPGSGGFALLGIGNPYVVKGDVIAVIDPTGFALQADVAADLSDSLIDGLPFRRACFPMQEGWATGFGSYRNRSKQDNIIDYTNIVGGLLLGYDVIIRGERFTFLLAGAYDNAVVSHQTQMADVYMAAGGICYSRISKKTAFDIAALGGYLRWDNSRVVENNLASGGQENATASVDGGFATADLSISHSFLYMMFAFNLRYAGLYLGNYLETGSLADLSLYRRYVNLITTRLEGSYAIRNWLEPYVGGYGRYQVTGYTVHSYLLKESLVFEQGGPKNLSAFLCGLRGAFWELFYNAEFSVDNAQSMRVLGELKWVF